MVENVTRERAIQLIKEKIGKELLRQLENGEVPKLLITDRSQNNVEYSETLKYLIMKDKKNERKLNELGELHPFLQTLLIAKSVMQILQEGQLTTKRDLFYDNQFRIPDTRRLTFEKQSESDIILQDLEVLTGVIREDMGIVADPKGAIVGDIKIQSGDDVIDCSKQGDGAWSIPSTIGRSSFVENNAKFVLVVEKGAIFTKLNGSKFWRNNNCLLMTGGGQADRGTRRLVRKLNVELNLPVYILTDGDSYGWYIYSVYTCGSMSLAYESKNLACPNAKFLGVTTSDIFHYNIEDWALPAKPSDLKRAEDLLKYPWFKNDEFWQRELKLFLQKKLKCEIETLSRHLHSYRYLSDIYLPEKLREAGCNT